MISSSDFYNSLKNKGIDFFAGVPDSLLKDFCAYLQDNAQKNRHIISANEGNAVGLALGHYLATGNPALVYMQNSGQGNAVNPLTSLADKEVYGIPILLLVGWRSEPGIKDEPQHAKQGRITLDLLKTLEIPYSILEDSFEKNLEDALKYMKEKSSPYALIAKKGTFEEYKSKPIDSKYSLTREDALKIVLSRLEKEVVVSTTGMLSRELFELREQSKQNHEKDFLVVGGMGHASSIALGIALNSEKQVYCLDGDGSVLMHMGSLAVNALANSKNFRHIVFNNGSHESVGGQPTAASDLNLADIAKSCSYKSVFIAENKEELEKEIQNLAKSEGPSFLEIKIKKGHRKDLGRPTKSSEENKISFMNYLKT
jgi:phosphonopyruvate decarboxylase